MCDFPECRECGKTMGWNDSFSCSQCDAKSGESAILERLDECMNELDPVTATKCQVRMYGKFYYIKTGRMITEEDISNE